MYYELPEHKFARDFVYCVMKKWRPEWKESGFFLLENDVPKYFTPAMREKILPLVEINRDVYQRTFESYFPDAEVDLLHFRYAAENIVHEYISFVKPPHFLPDRFFYTCLKIARFGALAICFGVEKAPHLAADFIYTIVMMCKDETLFSEQTWIQFDKYCAGLKFTPHV